MNKVRLLATSFLLWMGLSTWMLVSGCSSSHSFSNGVYRDEEASYRVGPLNTQWKRITINAQNDLAWHRSDLSAIIQINASCNPSMDVPLKALTNHLIIGFTERKILEQQLLPMVSREALRTHLIAKLDGVPQELMLTVLKKDMCVYDFTLVAPPGNNFKKALQDYLTLLTGFQARLYSSRFADGSGLEPNDQHQCPNPGRTLNRLQPCHDDPLHLPTRAVIAWSSIRSISQKRSTTLHPSNLSL